MNGTAWLDANFNKIADIGEPLLQGWTVALFRNGVQVQSVLTDVNGNYRFGGVPPTDGTPDHYEVRFTAPGAGPNTAKLGKADSVFTNSLQRITDILVPAGSNLLNLNLPIGPNGVVYNSLTRTPIAGVTLNMLRAGTPLPAACFDDPAQQGQITQAGGYYRFDLNFTDPACSSGGSYLIKVTAPRRTSWPVSRRSSHRLPTQRPLRFLCLPVRVVCRMRFQPSRSAKHSVGVCAAILRAPAQRWD